MLTCPARISISGYAELAELEVTAAHARDVVDEAAVGRNEMASVQRRRMLL